MRDNIEKWTCQTCTPTDFLCYFIILTSDGNAWDLIYHRNKSWKSELWDTARVAQWLECQPSKLVTRVRIPARALPFCSDDQFRSQILSANTWIMFPIAVSQAIWSGLTKSWVKITVFNTCYGAYAKNGIVFHTAVVRAPKWGLNRCALKKGMSLCPVTLKNS